MNLIWDSDLIRLLDLVKCHGFNLSVLSVARVGDDVLLEDVPIRAASVGINHESIKIAVCPTIALLNHGLDRLPVDPESAWWLVADRFRMGINTPRIEAERTLGSAWSILHANETHLMCPTSTTFQPAFAVPVIVAAVESNVAGDRDGEPIGQGVSHILPRSDRGDLIHSVLLAEINQDLGWTIPTPVVSQLA